MRLGDFVRLLSSKRDANLTIYSRQVRNPRQDATLMRACTYRYRTARAICLIPYG
jgi:hypothetical protein